jgi:hypothetical protein
MTTYQKLFKCETGTSFDMAARSLSRHLRCAAALFEIRGDCDPEQGGRRPVVSVGVYTVRHMKGGGER